MTSGNVDDARSARSAWEELAASGYDVSSLERNLARTPLERLRRHDRFLRMVGVLRGAGEVSREGS